MRRGRAAGRWDLCATRVVAREVRDRTDAERLWCLVWGRMRRYDERCGVRRRLFGRRRESRVFPSANGG